MLILHVITGLTPGGAELMLKRLLSAHAGNPDFRHHVISLHTKGTIGPQLEELGITVEALHMRGSLSMPAALWRISKRVRELAPDVVHTWMYHADLIGGLAARLAGQKAVIWSVRATHIPGGQGTSRITGLVRLMCAALSPWIPREVVYVANSARDVHERLGYSRSKSLVIHNGYHIPHAVGGEADRLSLRRELKVPQDAFLIGTAGRFNALKDYRTFVKAAAQLSARHQAVHFVMMGRGLVQTNSELVRWIEDSGYANRFHLLGEQHQLDVRLKGLDIFTLHSIAEGFPNVVAEAMALGLPVVITDVGDAAMLGGESALVVPASNPKALAGAIERLILDGPAARALRGFQGRKRVETEFSLDRIVERYEALYAAHSKAPGTVLATSECLGRFQQTHLTGD